MTFGFGGRENKSTDKPLFERAVSAMQEKPVILVGEGKNTYITPNGEYFFMGRKVTKEEYEKGLDQYNQIQDMVLAQKRAELN